MPKGWKQGRKRSPSTTGSQGSHQAPPPGSTAIPLTQGWVAWVDANDYKSLSLFAWQIHRGTRHYYVARNATNAERSGGQVAMIKMSNQIISPPPGMLVDHIVHHPFPKVADNRRSNLQVATKRQNTQGKRKTLSPTVSPFKGLVWAKDRNKWRSMIKLNGIVKCLGQFTVEAHAAYAYDLAAVRYFGPYASTNFPIPGSVRWEGQ